MTNTYRFELVEDSALTTSGFELRINVAVSTSLSEGEVSITHGCSTFGELDRQVTDLIKQLEKIRAAGRKRFEAGQLGPISLELE